MLSLSAKCVCRRRRESKELRCRRGTGPPRQMRGLQELFCRTPSRTQCPDTPCSLCLLPGGADCLLPDLIHVPLPPPALCPNRLPLDSDRPGVQSNNKVSALCQWDGTSLLLSLKCGNLSAHLPVSCS
ncbi:uncharacterized protein LJ206_007162 isoform 1-T1 [Theristicus caerulescens]